MNIDKKEFLKDLPKFKKSFILELENEEIFIIGWESLYFFYQIKFEKKYKQAKRGWDFKTFVDRLYHNQNKYIRGWFVVKYSTYESRSSFLPLTKWIEKDCPDYY